MTHAARSASLAVRTALPLATLHWLAMLVALTVGSIGLGTAARADLVFVPAAADTAPYSFVPSLLRFNNPALYAFEALDENSTPHDFETYLAFDVEQADLPAGHVLVAATLLVTYAFDFTGFGQPSSTPGEIACREVLEPWNPTTLTWANRPGVDAPFDTVVGITGFGALLCDATPIVLAWITNQTPNNGFALTNTTDRVIGMHSLESSADPSLKPQLILRTELPEPAAGLPLATGGVLLLMASRRRAVGVRKAARAEGGGDVGA